MDSYTSSSMNPIHSTAYSPSVGENLLPALVECFAIIILGYSFGRCKILSEQGAAGLCQFLQYLALPSLIFTSLATISFANINWHFIAAILISKSIIFVTVALTTMMLTKPVNLGKCGIYSIAATQSNDLALGYPIMLSLYKNYHPHYVSLLYIIVPIQLLLLNPVGFFLLEIHKQQSNPHRSQRHLCYAILKGVLSNPIIIMTVLGITWNYTFNSHPIPPVFGQMLLSLGSAFSPIALFLVGHNMSSKIDVVKGYFALTPALIVLMKIFVLPLVLQKVTVSFLSGFSPEEVESLSSLGFLYGTIPCAPTIFIFAKQYSVAVNEIATVAIYSTLFSAPLMFASATMISLSHNGFQNLYYYLTETIGYTSIANLVCCILLFIILTVRKRLYDVGSIAIVFILIGQSISSSSGLLLFFYNGSASIVQLQQILYSVGTLSTYMFTVFLGILIFILQWRSLCFVLRFRFLINILGFTIPCVMAIFLSTILTQRSSNCKEIHGLFPCGRNQVLYTLIIAVTTFLVTCILLISQHIYMRKRNTFSSTTLATNDNVVDDSDVIVNDEDAITGREQCRLIAPISYPRAMDIEDIAERLISPPPQHCNQIYQHACDASYNCNAQQHAHCSSQVQTYQHSLPTEESDINDSNQYVKYVILILCLCSSMLITIVMCISKLVTESVNGILVEIQFLNAILHHCQGVICFILFGLNSYICNLVLRCCQYICTRYNSEMNNYERINT